MIFFFFFFRGHRWFSSTLQKEGVRGVFQKKKKRKVVAICNLTTSKPRNPTHWTFNIRDVFVILKGPVVKTQKTAQIKSGELIFKDFYSQRCQIMMYKYFLTILNSVLNFFFNFCCLHFNTHICTFYSLRFQNRLFSFNAFEENHHARQMNRDETAWKTVKMLTDREGDSNGEKRCVSVSYLQRVWVTTQDFRSPGNKTQQSTVVLVCLRTARTNRTGGNVLLFVRMYSLSFTLVKKLNQYFFFYSSIWTWMCALLPPLILQCFTDHRQNSVHLHCTGSLEQKLTYAWSAYRYIRVCLFGKFWWNVPFYCP